MDELHFRNALPAGRYAAGDPLLPLGRVGWSGHAPGRGLRSSGIPLRLVHGGDFRRGDPAQGRDSVLELARGIHQERRANDADLPSVLLGMDTLQPPTDHPPLECGAPRQDRLRESGLTHQHASVRELVLHLHGSSRAVHHRGDGYERVGRRQALDERALLTTNTHKPARMEATTSSVQGPNRNSERVLSCLWFES